jgi:hypothetical protein
MQEWCFTVMRRGKPSHTNIVYFWALTGASFLAREIGEDHAADRLRADALEVSAGVRAELWDEARGAFADTTTDRRRVPQDANSMAIASGMVDRPRQAARILGFLRLNMWEEWGSTNVDVPYYRLTPGFPYHNKRVVPFMNNYEALARFVYGDNDGAMELIRRCWGGMVNQEPGTTFWEWTGKNGEVPGRFTSLCHGWSAGVVPLLSKYVLGIRPASPGYSRFVVDPRPVGLEWVEGRVPVPGGFIEARVARRRNGTYEIRMAAPAGIDQVPVERRL